MSSVIDEASSKIDDLLEKVSGPTGRFGHTGQRAYAMRKAGVSEAVTAAQLTATSKHGHKYTADFAEQLCNLFEDCLSGTPIPKPVAKALIKDQRSVERQNGDLLPA
ncbi:hypothetical protein [Devosia sp.]|uniref:hypothetical protein n=1 Tax=Devosia sp. TaxID=1871048 RepID=UPI002732347D|nr:hypothetical protein [Devosia sp.]MDP2779786.1 hypothetical protein [Devosia sp.]